MALECRSELFSRYVATWEKRRTLERDLSSSTLSSRETKRACRSTLRRLHDRNEGLERYGALLDAQEREISRLRTELLRRAAGATELSIACDPKRRPNATSPGLLLQDRASQSAQQPHRAAERALAQRAPDETARQARDQKSTRGSTVHFDLSCSKSADLFLPSLATFSQTTN